MEFSEKEAAFIANITKYDRVIDIQIGDFRVRNPYGVVADYIGPGGDVVIPENDIFEKAKFNFKGSNPITSLVVSGSVNTLSAFQFDGLWESSKNSLKRLIISEGVKEIIRDDFFKGFKNLSEVSLPESLQYLGKDAFKGTPWYKKTIQEENGCCYLGNFLISSDKTIEECNIREGTVCICENAFRLRQSLRTAIIPASVKTIGYSAFRNCRKLEEIFIPESVMEIGWYAFTQCTALKTVEVLAENASVEEFSFTEKKYTVPQKAFYPKRYFDERKLGPIKDYYALCYLTSAERYTEEERTDYNKYIKKRRSRILAVILAAGRMDLLKQSADFVLDPEKIDFTIEDAQEACEIELTAFLIDWKDKHVKKKSANESGEFDLDKPLSVSDLKKIWKTTKMPDGTLGITGYKGRETIIEIPAAIGKDPVTTICKAAFNANTKSPIGKKITREQARVLKKITTVFIPEGITSIESFAFNAWDAFREIYLPKSVQDMASYTGITKKVKIYAPKGSYAIEYAKSNGNDYEEE